MEWILTLAISRKIEELSLQGWDLLLEFRCYRRTSLDITVLDLSARCMIEHVNYFMPSGEG